MARGDQWRYRRISRRRECFISIVRAHVLQCTLQRPSQPQKMPKSLTSSLPGGPSERSGSRNHSRRASDANESDSGMGALTGISSRSPKLGATEWSSERLRRRGVRWPVINMRVAVVIHVNGGSNILNYHNSNTIKVAIKENTHFIKAVQDMEKFHFLVQYQEKKFPQKFQPQYWRPLNG